MSITDIARAHKIDQEMLSAGMLTEHEYHDRCKERLSDLLSSVMVEPQDDEGIC